MRPVPALVTIALVLSTALAGCIAQDDLGTSSADLPEEAAAEHPAEVPWSLRGCEAVVGLVPVERDALADRVPEGFRALTPEEFGLPPDPRGDALLGVEGFRCSEVDTLDGTLEDAVYASLFIPVEPPADLRDDAFTYTFLKFEVLVADEGTRSLLQDHGIPALGGDVSPVAPAPTGPAFSMAVTLGEEVYGLHGGMGPANEGFQERFLFQEFTPTPEGLAYWTTSSSADAMHTSTGYVKLDPNGWPAEVVGSTRAPAYMLHGVGVSFEDAVLTLPSAS